MNLAHQLELAEMRMTYRALTETALNLRQAVAHLTATGWTVNAAGLAEALAVVEAAMTGLESYSTALGMEL